MPCYVRISSLWTGSTGFYTSLIIIPVLIENEYILDFQKRMKLFILFNSKNAIKH